VVTDQTGKIQITWFNQTYLARSIRVGESYAFSGKVKAFRGHLSLQSPEYEKVDQTTTPLKLDNIHTGRLVPVYPETAGVSSKWLRSRINHTLKLVEAIDHLPQSLLDLYNLHP